MNLLNNTITGRSSGSNCGPLKLQNSKISNYQLWSSDLYISYIVDFLNLQREVRPLVALSRLLHNLEPLARNERLPVTMLKKGVYKSILVDARVV